jgi:hypothetical protein
MPKTAAEYGARKGLSGIWLQSGQIGAESPFFAKQKCAQIPMP